MKTILSAAIGLLACTASTHSAYAQAPAQLWHAILTPLPVVNPSTAAPVVLHPYQAQLAAKKKAAAPHAKITATASRLISSAELKPVNFVFTYKDSTVYAYSGGRGSDLNSPEAQYDAYTTYRYNTGTAQFATYQRGTFTYNAANKMTDGLNQTWDAPTQTWKNTYHTVNTYDGQNNLLTEQRQSWDANAAAWKNTGLVTYTYDGLNQLTNRTFQTWDANAAAWKNSSQDLLTYAGMLLQTTVARTWDVNTNAWKNNSRSEYTYDAADLVIKQKELYWNANAATWMNDFQGVYTYTASGDLQSYQQMIWNTQTSVYDGVTLDTYTYTSTGKAATEVGQQWNGNFWVNTYRRQYAYDAQDREVSRVHDNWVVNTNSWKAIDGYFTAYNAADLPSRIIYKTADAANVLQNESQELFEYNTWEQVTRTEEQSWTGTLWLALPADSRNNYRYEDYQATGIAQAGHLDADVRIFPNPAANYIRITARFAKPQAAGVIITDAAGRIVQRTEFTNASSLNDVISLSVLPAGLYSVTLRTASGQHSERVSVVK